MAPDSAFFLKDPHPNYLYVPKCLMFPENYMLFPGVFPAATIPQTY